MQQIAREFNYSESAFVFPSRSGHTRHVRIFTPAREVPFAGHPNVGTAFVLASIGAFGDVRSSLTVTFEEAAGLVPITIRESEGKITSCELAAPQPLSLGEELAPDLVAAAVSLRADDIATATHPPRIASVGLPFVVTALRDLSALERIRVDLAGFQAILDVGIRPSLYFYVQAAGSVELRARMFAPLSGVPEDPATGSATCAAGSLLAHHRPESEGEFRYQFAQGVEMGRPSQLAARVRKVAGVVETAHVAGSSVLVTEGLIHVMDGDLDQTTCRDLESALRHREGEPSREPEPSRG